MCSPSISCIRCLARCLAHEAEAMSDAAVQEQVGCCGPPLRRSHCSRPLQACIWLPPSRSPAPCTLGRKSPLPLPPHPLRAPDPQPSGVCQPGSGGQQARRADERCGADRCVCGHGVVLALLRLRLRCGRGWVVWDAAAEAAVDLGLPCSHAACLRRLLAALSYSKVELDCVLPSHVRRDWLRLR